MANLGTRHFADIGGLRTAYYQAGTGKETILFIYGGNAGTSDSASNAGVWSLNYAPLSKTHNVVTFDKLGQGYTGFPDDAQGFRMENIVAHVREVVRYLKLPPVHVVGHSRGGYIATRLTLENPEMVKSLTIVSSGTLSPTVSTNALALAGPPYPTFTRESARWVYENYCYRREAVTDDWMDDVEAVLNDPGYRACCAKVAKEKISARIAIPELEGYKSKTFMEIEQGRLQRPTQIMWALNDPTVQVEGGLRLFDIISAKQRRTVLNIINEAGHFVYREQAERFNALLDGWVRMNGEEGQ